MVRKVLMIPIALVAVLIGVGLGGAGYAHHREAPQLELVRKFDPAKSEFPKGIDFDRRGNIYIGMQYLGEVRRIKPNGDEEVYAKVPFSGPVGTGLLNALATVERPGQGVTVYAAFVDFHSGAATGIYKILGDGAVSRVPGSEAVAGNGMTVDSHDNIYVADSLTGSVWRVNTHSDVVELWVQHELLEGDGSSGFGVRLGVGDMKVDGKSLLVTVEEKARLVRIKIGRDGTAGDLETVVEDPSLYMTEGVAVARNGDIYVSSWFNSTLSVLGKHEGLRVVADSEDGLLGPVTLAFGQGRHSKYLYIVNQSGFIFADPKPALYRVALAH